MSQTNKSEMYKCPACSSSLFFDAAKQKMVCQSCANEYDVQDIEMLEQIDRRVNRTEQSQWGSVQSSTTWTSEEMSRMHSYRCPSCGGEIVAEEDQASTRCVYCGNPLVMGDVLVGMSRPDFVIPFSQTREQAVAQYKAYLKKKKLLPSSFERMNRVEEIKGVYVPFWLFDCGTDGDVTWRATRVSQKRQGNYEVTTTKHYLVHRGGTMEFANVPADASVRMDDTIMEAVEPFDIKDKKDFSLPYLSGFGAQKADVEPEQARRRADERIRNSIVSRLSSTVLGYTTLVMQKCTVDIQQKAVQ